MDGKEVRIKDPTTPEEMERKKDALLYLSLSRIENREQGRAAYDEAVSLDPDEVFDALMVMAMASDIKDSVIAKKQERIERQNEKIITLIGEKEGLEEKAHIDKLTKLFNRGQYEEDIISYVEKMEKGMRANEKRNPVSAIMIDIDNFSGINEYGHSVGDQALRAVGRIIMEEVGMTGNSYRYGGEELFVLMPGTGIPEAREIAENIRASIENYTFRFTDKDTKEVKETGFTVSAGVGSVGEGDYPKPMNDIYTNEGLVRDFIAKQPEQEMGDKKRQCYQRINKIINRFLREYSRNGTEKMIKKYGKILRDTGPEFREQYHIELMAHALIERADEAERCAKRDGKNGVYVFDTESGRPVMYSKGRDIGLDKDKPASGSLKNFSEE